MDDLALIYNALGQYSEAAELAKDAWERRERILGVGHPDTLSSINLLAFSYRRQELWHDAAHLGERAIEIGKTSDPETIMWMSHNLAVVYHELGRLEEAERLTRAALETGRQLDTMSSEDSKLQIQTWLSNLENFRESLKEEVQKQMDALDTPTSTEFQDDQRFWK